MHHTFYDNNGNMDEKFFGNLLRFRRINKVLEHVEVLTNLSISNATHHTSGSNIMVNGVFGLNEMQREREKEESTTIITNNETSADSIRERERETKNS